MPVATHHPKQCPWMDGFVDGAPYPYLTDPCEAAQAFAAADARNYQAAMLHSPFVPACTGQHLGDAPTASLEREQLAMLATVVAADWEDAVVCLSFSPHSILLPQCCHEIAMVSRQEDSESVLVPKCAVLLEARSPIF